MTDKWEKLYLQPFYDLPHNTFPGCDSCVDIPGPLSIVTRLMAVPWTVHHDRCVQAFHSDLQLVR